MSISVSLLELCPSSKASASTLSDLGGARLGVRAVPGLDGVESDCCEFDGAGLAGPAFRGLRFCELEFRGLAFCAHTATPHARNTTNGTLRIRIILPLSVRRAECLQALARRLQLG